MARTMDYFNYTGALAPQSGASKRTYTGTAAADNFVGTDLNEAFIGNLGSDTLAGGAGDDLYVVQNSVTKVIEAANAGIDTVKVTMDYVLPENVENLVMYGQGSRSGFTGLGNALNNLIIGDANRQTMNGLKGDDILVGNGGSDTFVFGRGGGQDVIVDFTAGVGTGSDTLRIQDFSLTTFEQVKSAMSQVGADVVLSLGTGDAVTFRNTTINAFTSDNFKLALDFSKLTLTFEDQFNTLSVQTMGQAGTGVWATEYGFAGWGSKVSHYIGDSTGEDQIYVDPTYAGTGTTALGINPFSLNNGILTITATANTAEQKAALYGLEFSSGLLTTRTSFLQTYGYFEMRAMMPTGTGAWPAFWLFSPAGTQELDIFEVISEKPNQINMTVHDKSYSTGMVGGSSYLTDSQTAFHTYGLMWTAETLTYYIDGVAVYSLATPAYMHGPMYILLNQAVGGWASTPDPANMPGGFQVDYVRAYSVAETSAVPKPPVTDGGASGGGTTEPGVTISTGSATYTLTATENHLAYTGAGAFKGNGNDLANKITGGAGNDVLDGGKGIDTLTGGAGNDTYFVDNVSDVVVEAANCGYDLVRSTTSAYALGANIENLTFTGTGAFSGWGNSLSNVITSGTGNDTLDGGLGADRLVGGLGDDTYYVDSASDAVVELAGEGYDTQITALTSAKAALNVEALKYSGALAFTGFAGASGTAITGGIGADTLFGAAGADVLNGGAGADLMNGGTGNDIFVVDNAGDRVIEAAGGGYDTVRTTLSTYTLASEVEALAYAGSMVFTGTGNALANQLTGGANADTLSGAGGADTLDGGLGTDRLIGGAGDDVYLLDNVGDVVIEAANEGIDTIRTALGTVTLGANIENLIYTGASGLKATGNALANQIVGGVGNNVLDGGAGADTLTGGVGSDTYLVDNAGDVVIEALNGGYDLVKATASAYVLSDNIENLTFLGTGDFAGTGNALSNVITGGAGNDTLNGGAGGDRLVGGAGNDLYILDSTGDVVVELAGGGYDTQVTSASSAIAAANIEALTYSGTGAFTGYANSGGTVVTGGAGIDTLVGGAGSDVLIGGAGADVLSGGAGADIFRFDSIGQGVDRISDFQVGVDHFALKATAFGVTTLSDLSFVSGVAPHAADSQATLLYDTSTGGLYYDATGGDGADKVQIATLSNKAAVSLSDFWLV